MIRLRNYQIDAIKRMKNGCVLCGGVGSGKSLTSLAYYYLLQGGDNSFLNGESYVRMNENLKDLIIITTARKRDDLEWDKELIPFFLNKNAELNLYSNTVIIDSWNNIKNTKK